MTEPTPAASVACRCQGHAHNALPDHNGYCLQCPCTTPPVLLASPSDRKQVR